MQASLVTSMAGKREHIIVIIIINYVGALYTVSRMSREKYPLRPRRATMGPWCRTRTRVWRCAQHVRAATAVTRRRRPFVFLSVARGVHRSRGLRRRWRRSGRIFSLPPPHSPYRWHAGASQMMHFSSVINALAAADAKSRSQTPPPLPPSIFLRRALLKFEIAQI